MEHSNIQINENNCGPSVIKYLNRIGKKYKFEYKKT